MTQRECVSALSTPIGAALVKWLASRSSDGVIVGPGFSGLACACRGSAADAQAAEAALRAGVLVRYSTRSAYGGGLWTWLGRGDDLTIRFDREVLRDPSLRLGDYGEQWVEEMTGHNPATPDLGTPPSPR